VPIRITALDHLVINVADVARSARWYQQILGMEVRVFDPGGGKVPRTSLVFGDQKINLRPADADKADWFTADRVAAGSDDLCFLTTATPDQVVAHLGAAGVTSSGAGVETGRARHAALGLLPRSRRQPDRDRVLREDARIRRTMFAAPPFTLRTPPGGTPATTADRACRPSPPSRKRLVWGEWHR